jgi:hypothetical protein
MTPTQISSFVALKKQAADPALVSVYKHVITGEEFTYVSPDALHKTRKDAAHAARGTLVKG